MGNEADKKFTWVIKNFSSLKSKIVYSDQFVIGGCKWRLFAYTGGSFHLFPVNLEVAALWMEKKGTISLINSKPNSRKRLQS